MRFALKSEWFPLLILAATAVVTALWYDNLPARVPSHWGITGQIDGYTSPLGHILMFAGLTALLYVLFSIIPRLEPRKENMAASMSFLLAIRNVMLGFFFSIYTLISYMAVYNVNLPMEKYIAIGVGILFIVIGSYLTQVKSNYFMGIRTPWTLHADSIWEKTHRLGSRTFIAAGALFILGAFFPVPLNFIIPICGILVAALAPILYSYWLYRQNK